MDIGRRQVLGALAKGGLPLLASSAIGGATCHASELSASAPVPPRDAVSMLYDATKCTGCRACVSACAEANDLVPDARRDGLHQTPLYLNQFTKNIIKLYDPPGGESSFVKRQCMHCLEPACAAACPFGALDKRETDGVVTWDGSRCIGCRYCEVACPFEVPKFEWDAQNPAIVKCEFCQHRLAVHEQPACTAVCPTGAVIFGPRSVLLDGAKSRIAATPDKYFENRVYGEHEAGGTQVLYLSHVPFTALGLPALSPDARPGRYLRWQTLLYKFFALPLGLYAVAVAVMRQNFVDHQHELLEESEKTGVDPQL
jgi:Fe-S-cluster-containing dehydrogenase component